MSRLVSNLIPRCWEVPTRVVMGAQPYATLGGVGLSLDVERVEVRAGTAVGGPLTDAHVCSAYVHLGIDALMEYCTGPGGSHVPNVIQNLGELNTLYTTVEIPGLVRHSSPTHLGVELCKSEMRGLNDVRLSLYDDTRRPLVSFLVSGPPKGSPAPPVIVSSIKVESPPTTSSVGSIVGNGLEDMASLFEVVGISPSTASEGAFLSQTVVIPSCLGGVEVGAVVPPWVVHAAVGDFMSGILDLGASESGCAGGVGGAVVASHVTALSDVLCDTPFELRARRVSFHPAYYSVPWGHRIGMPTLRGQPCCNIVVEVVQADVVLHTGRYCVTL